MAMDPEQIDEVPAGFTRMPEGLGFGDTLQPSYRLISDDTASVGLVVDDQHLNLMGLCHGGVLMTLADVAAATGVNVAIGRRGGNPTINLSVDFISAARKGEWIQADLEGISLKRRFGFSHGIIRNRRGVVARFNGTFYLPEHGGMWKEGRGPDAALLGLGE